MVACPAEKREVELNMREAIAFHLDGLREGGQTAPEPHTYSAYVELRPKRKRLQSEGVSIFTFNFPISDFFYK
jgi:hypothetical protein